MSLIDPAPEATPQRVGVLLVNVGSPSAPTTAAVRAYLREFLSDPRLIELPRWQWLPILYLFVLTTRPARSAKAYQKVWTDQGSPLISIAQAQRDALERGLQGRFGDSVRVALGMGYGEPSLPGALDSLRQQGCDRLVVLPLFPQYSSATAGSVMEGVMRTLANWRVVPELRSIHSYYQEPDYIAALAASVRERWSDGQRHLLLSFHGVPQRYVDAGDPYQRQCERTAALLVEALQLSPEQFTLSWQSRFGREAWLEPSTVDTLERLAEEGLRQVDVICPGFSADCLETLEEIALEGAEVFQEAGGQELRLIPCLNERPDHLAMLQRRVVDELGDWVQEQEPGMSKS